MRRIPATLDSPCNYEVIGEHLNDPTHLLALGDDGQFYSLNLLDGQTEPTDFGDQWVMDAYDLHEKLSRIHLN